MTDLNLNRPPSITIDQTSEVTCSKCNGNAFTESFLLRKASRIVTGATKDSYIPLNIFSCAACGHTNEEFIPSELKKPKSTL